MHTTIVRTATAGAGAAGLAGVALAALGSYFVRQILTPTSASYDEVILEVNADTVRLKSTSASTAPGRYSLYWDTMSGHARLGEVRESDERSVVRELLGVDFGQLRVGRARLAGYFYPAPSQQDGTQLTDVIIDGPLGDIPAWLGAAADEGAGRSAHPAVWAILVHGRGATRAETLRVVPTLRELGVSILVPSYRNDSDAPPSPDGRYHLGLSEWRDIEAAMEYAVQHGAQRIALFGWSMGGAIVLQLLAHSAHVDRVVAVVLDAPVVSWRQVIDFHAGVHRVPLALSHTGQRLIGKSWSKSFGGVSVPLPIPQTDWITRADDLHVPTLLIHSEDDDFVPYGPSADLARARPDVIQFESWTGALHCREWNVDAQRWEAAVRDFLRQRIADCDSVTKPVG